MGDDAVALPWVALAVAATAGECMTVADIREQLLPVLAAVTGADLAAFHQIAVRPDAQEFTVGWPADDRWEVVLRDYSAVMGHSPLTQHFLATATPGLVTLRQLVSASAWHQNPLYVECHRRLEVEDHLALVLSFHEGRAHVFTLARARGVFSLDDLRLVHALTPHLRSTLRRALAQPEGYEVLRLMPVPTWTWRVGPALPPAGDALVLTDREQQVLARISGTSTSRQVARDLQISPRTVDKHLENAFRKLRASCRAEALERLADLGVRFDR